MKFTSRLGQVSNEKKGKLKLPPYHPMHKNPFYYDDQVQEIYDANGVKKRDKVDIVRKGVEGKCSKSPPSVSTPFLKLMSVLILSDSNKIKRIYTFYKIKVLKN